LKTGLLPDYVHKQVAHLWWEFVLPAAPDLVTYLRLTLQAEFDLYTAETLGPKRRGKGLVVRN